MVFQLTEVKQLGKEEGTVKIEDLVGQKDLVETWQFNFEVDEEWFVDRLHPDATPKIHIYHGMKSRASNDPKTMTIPGMVSRELTSTFVSVPDPYGTHHTKMMINFYTNDCLEVIIHTANLLESQWANAAQGVWRSGRIARKLDTKKESSFQQNLSSYLSHYRMRPLTLLAAKLANYDFCLQIPDKQVALIASCPGSYGSSLMGQDGISLFLSRYPTDRMICQVSSLTLKCFEAGHYDAFKTNFHTRSIDVVFPTVKEVAQSFDGYASGRSIFCTRSDNLKSRKLYAIAKQHLYHWIGPRCRASPHIKTYVGIANGTVSWYLLTSANLSLTAWGYFVKRRRENWVQNYELGVLIRGPEAAQMLLPYDLPVVKYSPEDEVWSPNLSYNQPDCHGNTWKGI